MSKLSLNYTVDLKKKSIDLNGSSIKNIKHNIYNTKIKFILIIINNKTFGITSF